MRKSNYILLVILIALLNSCTEQKNYIVETGFSLLMPDTINGETVAQSRKKGAVYLEKLESNTINKYIPNIPVYGLSGQKLNLQDVISKKTILISSDSYCGFGRASLTDDFPIALDSLKDELQDYDIICLVKRTETDIEDSSRLEEFTSELQEIYESIYIIEESDAYKMNLSGNPARFYINEDQKVSHIAGGLSNVQSQIKEIRINTDANIMYK